MRSGSGSFVGLSSGATSIGDSGCTNRSPNAYNLARANKGAPGVDALAHVPWTELRGDRVQGCGGVADWYPTGVTQQDVSTTTGAAGDDPQARGRRAATRHSDHACVRKRIRDRVVQTAAKLVLEPVFEADLDPSAY